MTWWIGFWAFIALAQVQSLDRELRFCKPHGVARKVKWTVSFKGAMYLHSIFNN